MYLTYSRLFIVREARLGLPSTCRGGKGREAGQRCGVGRCEEGGQCGGGWERGRGAHHNASDHGGSSGVSAGAPRWPSTVKKNLLKRLCQSVVSTVHTTGGPAQGPHGSGISSATNCFATARERFPPAVVFFHSIRAPQWTLEGRARERGSAARGPLPRRTLPN